ncbi:MAG: hypothetical protein DRJ51_07730 [Thermoprotei archaeon]|nr:MAG: hypothetical protein DRJ51_07730 [Thermoprotei archaeon]
MRIKRLMGFLYIDFKEWLAYKYELFFWLLNTLVGAFTYAFLGTYITVYRKDIMLRYGSFLPFLLVGMAYNYIIYASLSAPRMAINPWNLTWRLLIPARVYEIIIGSVLFRYIIGVLQFLMYFGVAIAFGARFNINLVSTLVAIILGVAVMWGLGMISAGVQVITKRWDPVTWFLTMLGGLFSGVWFPYQLLPKSLQCISMILPQTYILDMLRRAMLKAEPLTGLIDSLIPLTISAAVTLSIGYYMYLKSIEYAKKHGTVGEY